MRAFSCFCYFILFCALNSGTIFKSFALDENEIRTKNYYYIVKDGDNLFRISLKYNVKQHILAELNNLKNNNVYVGQRLKLPDDIKNMDDVKINNNIVKQEKSLKKQDEKTKKAQQLDESKEKDKNSVSNVKKDIKNNANEKENNTNNSNNTTGISKNTQKKMFIWPIKGQIISKFNSQTSSGGKNLGVYIASRQGEKVASISDGVVKFVGYIDNFDTVIIIKHYNGFYSAYGFVEPDVSMNEKVKQGQIIADIKPKKESKRRILYFSIRKNNKSYNPEEIIGNNNQNIVK